MCIIIYKKENAILPNYEVLKQCFTRNPNGAGFCYIDKKTNRIKLEKGFFDFSSFYKRLLEIYNNKHLLIHMRIATGGLLDKRNCHPFKINNNLYFAHNGVFEETLAKSNQIFSDTYTFNEILKNFNFKLKDLNSRYFKYLLMEKIKSNKIVFFEKNKAVILNEELGFWKNGVWFSNNNFIEADKFYTNTAVFNNSKNYYLD